jgi:type IV secretory pathway TraG/TraD family ATPase VirD4
MAAVDAFETQLQRDLPRGRVERPAVGTGERGRFARWLKPEELTGKDWNYEQGGLLLGRRAGRLIGWKDDRHVFMVAGNRSGKGRSFLINYLLSPSRMAAN